MLHYIKLGSGEPLVLVHGFPNDGTTWNTITDQLSQDYTLIIPDLPGAGKSDMEPSLSMEKMANALKVVLDKEKIESAVFAGHSMGGYTIMQYVTLFPETVKGLSLVHSLASADDEEKKTARKKSIKLLQNGTEGKQTFLKAMAENLFSESYKTQHPNAILKIVENGMKLSAEALSEFYTAIMNREDKRDWLKQNKHIPIQWIIGDEDKATPMKDALQQCTLSAVNDVQIYKPCGHMSMMEMPDRLAKDLKDFADFIYKN